MTRYTDLRDAGYFKDGISDEERAKIAAKVSKAASERTVEPTKKTTAPRK